MAGSVNKVILVGNVGADPEIRSLPAGSRVANLRIATSDTWRDKNTGERRERTEWHSIVVFNEGLVKVIEQYVKKGAKLYIEGALQTRKWQDQQGQDRYTTEIVLQNYRGELQMLDSRNAGSGDYNQVSQGGGAYNSGVYGGGNQSGYSNANRGGQNVGEQQGNARQQAGGAPDFSRDLDDEVPF